MPSGEGTTQIDHVIVSRYSVFVVETKNMSGWIFGTERDAQWTQKFRKSSYRFRNPLRQNYKHTETLAELLSLPRQAIKSVIVFVGGAQLKKEVPANVTITGGYIRFIQSHKEEILSEDEVQRVLDMIASSRLAPSLRTHQQHVEHVQDLVTAKTLARDTTLVKPNSQPTSTASSPASQSVAATLADTTENVQDAPACPNCGIAMVLRAARKGQAAGERFWGCPRFPKCRGLQ